MKTVEDLEQALAQYRDGERGLPTYKELEDLLEALKAAKFAALGAA